MLNISIESFDETKHLFAIYYPLILVIAGTFFNSFTLILLCQSTFKNTTTRPTIYYMRTIAIFDILMLYGWNLDHYLFGFHQFSLQRYSIFLCKIFSFLNYFTSQVSAWLRVFICLDRYLSLSRPHQTWITRPQNVLRIIICIILVFILINGHFFLFACYKNFNGTINPQSMFYQIYPYWDYVNLALYNCLPFILMVVFNSGVLYHLIHLHQNVTLSHLRIQHRAITITLVITTCLFLIMTIPATIFYAFFYKTTSEPVLYLFDSLLYTYHTLSFLIYLITFAEFRRLVIRLLKPQLWSRIQPTAFPLPLI